MNSIVISFLLAVILSLLILGTVLVLLMGTIIDLLNTLGTMVGEMWDDLSDD